MNTIETVNLNFINNIKYKDCTISSDKITFITGASGSGKSSLLKLISYNILPSSGTIFFNKKDIKEYAPFEYRRLVTLGLQEVFLFSGTIEENFYQYYDYRSQSRPTKDQIQQLLDTCVLNLPLSKDVSEMSGGERQRLYISIVMSFKPKFLLLDEPTSALDTENSFKVLENLINYSKEHSIGIIIVSHDSSLVLKYAEKIIDLGGDGLVP